MEADVVHARAAAFCDALDAGDIEQATAYMSPQLQQNLGEVLGLLPLPSSGSAVTSVDRRESGYRVVLRLVGETEEVELQTRWKDREGQPTIVEASHLSRAERMAAAATGEEGEPEGADG
jgi:hypothetical protein